MPSAGSRTALVALALLAGLGSAAWARPVHAATYVTDPLTAPTFTGRGSQGGSFGPNGFTTSKPSDSVWYEMPAPLPSGRVEYIITGLSLGTTLIEADNDIFTLYQAPTGETEPIPYWPWRNNDFKVFTRIFGTKEIGRPGAMKLELAGCPRGAPWWHDEPCPETCTSISGIAYANGNQNDVGWDANASYKMAVEWGNGGMTFFRDGVALGTVGYPGEFAPHPMRVRIGTPRDTMPVGVTVRDVSVTGTPGQMTPACASAPPPQDAGAPPPPPECDPYIEAVSLSPTAGSGNSATFETRYRHCQGASSFRIVQLWVGDSVGVGVPSLHLAYESGQFHLDGKSCTPGENVVLSHNLGSLDCALSSVQSTGDDLVAKWAVDFNVATFAGSHGVYVDAKGPSSMSPEPRLGWTWMGSFDVTTTTSNADGGTIPQLDGGVGSGGNGGTTPKGGTSESDDGGCGCRLAPRERSASLAWLALPAALLLRRRRPRQQRD